MTTSRFTFARSLCLAIPLTLLLVGGKAQAQAMTENFDGLTCFNGTSVTTSTTIPSGTGGLDWANSLCINGANYINNPSGYAAGTTSTPNAAVNGNGAPLALTRPGGGVFTLTKAQMTAAWNNNLQVTIEGFVGITSQGIQTVTLSATAPTLVTFTNATNIDRVVFTSSGGTSAYPNGGGTQFAMDDLSYFLGIPRAITATASPTAGGSVTCTPNPVADGANATCTASANAGYALTGFTGCTRMGTTNDCELSNVTAPATVSAAFTAVPAVLTSGTLPDATEGQFYSQALQATGGTAPYTWAVVSGSLPAGLTLDPATGVISGTVSKVAQVTKATGTFSFGVQVLDSSNPQLQSAVQQLTLQVVAAAPATVTPVPTLGAWAMALLGLITAGLGLRRRVNARA